MGDYIGDFNAGDIVYIERCFVDGTLAPTAIVSGSAICKRMGTLSVAPQGVGAITTSGGLCTLAIFTGSSVPFFTKGDYSVLVGRGTVTGTSVVDYTLAQFSIGRTTAITYSSNVLSWNSTAVSTPATAGIPDVNVKNIDNDAASASGTVTFPAGTLPSTTTTLSANVVQWQAANVSSAAAGIPKVDIDTIKTNPVVNGGTITFPTTATLASTTNITAGTITTVTNLTNAPTSGDFTSTMKTSIQTATTAVTQSADVKLWLAVAPNALISGRVDANVNATITAATVSTDVLKIAGVAVNTSLAQLGVNVVNIGGVASALATLSATVVGLSTAGITAEQNAVWDTAIAAHLGAGTTGAALNAAGAAGDPWITPIPGAYAAGQAGFLVGNLMDHTTMTVSANVVSINAVSTSPVTTVKAVQGLTTADTITTATNLTNAPTNGDFTATMKTSIQTQVTAVTVSADVKSINSISTSPVTTVKAVQGLTTADQVTTAVNLTTNNDKTGYALSAAGNNSAADAFLNRDIAGGSSLSDRNVQNTFRAIRNKTTLAGSTFTVFAEDDATPAWTAITTTTAAMSITSVDPA